MTGRYILGLCLVFVLGTSLAQKSATTFVLVRHAEKANDGTSDPDLTPEGRERAIRFSKLLAKTSIDAIYTTSFKRTRQTVQPLADAKGLQLVTYEAFKVSAVEDMIRAHRGGTIVVCGHSNNIPWTANLLIGKEQFEVFKEDEYENILVVDVVEKGKLTKVTRLVF